LASAILQAVDLQLSGGVSAPVSFEVQRGEIHGLLFPPEVERGPLLRVLAGLDRPRAGHVEMPSGTVRVVVCPPGGTLADTLGSPFDVALIDDAPAPANDRAVRDSWARIASERERGATIVVATSREEQAYRSDRVSLAMWDEAALRQAYSRLSRGISTLVGEFLELFEAGRDAPNAAVALRLRRLNMAARDLVREGRKHPRAWREMQALAGPLASQQLDDRVLEAVIRGAQDD
jgi:hypothetical protein